MMLLDKYLNRLTAIVSGDTTRYNFSVNTSIAASKATDRFVIVIAKEKSVLPVTFTKVNAYTKDKAVAVEWNVENETNISYYEVQKSANGTTFANAGTVNATGASMYTFTDETPVNGINYYRIKSVGNAGDIRYTRIVNVTLSVANNSSVNIYPNPLTGPSFMLKLTNMAAGTYTIQVTGTNGAMLYSKKISHGGGTASQKVTMSHSLAGGIYYLTLTPENGTSTIVKVVAN